MNQQQIETIDSFLREGNDSDALKQLHHWLKDNPHDGDVHYYIASTYDSKGEEKKAYPHYEKAMEVLLTCLIETTHDQNIIQYRNALAFYSKQLNRIWV